MFGSSNYFDEDYLAGQSIRTGTATGITPKRILAFDKKEMLCALHAEHEVEAGTAQGLLFA